MLSSPAAVSRRQGFEGREGLEVGFDPARAGGAGEEQAPAVVAKEIVPLEELDQVLGEALERLPLVEEVEEVEHEVEPSLGDRLVIPAGRRLHEARGRVVALDPFTEQPVGLRPLSVGIGQGHDQVGGVGEVLASQGRCLEGVQEPEDAATEERQSVRDGVGASLASPHALPTRSLPTRSLPLGDPLGRREILRLGLGTIGASGRALEGQRAADAEPLPQRLAGARAGWGATPGRGVLGRVRESEFETHARGTGALAPSVDPPSRGRPAESE